MPRVLFFIFLFFSEDGWVMFAFMFYFCYEPFLFSVLCTYDFIVKFTDVEAFLANLNPLTVFHNWGHQGFGLQF